MTKKIYLASSLIAVTVLLFTHFCDAQNGAINLSLGLNRQVSNKVKKINIGGHFSPGIEYRFNSNFALEGMVQFGVHNFDDKFHD